MSDWLRSADLVALFEQELRLCRVQAGESVLIFTDPRFPHPEYPPAALAAARCLGANAYILVSQGDQGFDDPLVRAAWCHADMVLGMSMLPSGIGSWMYTPVHDAALEAGARVLMVQEPQEVLKRMLPTDAIRRRGRLGAEALQAAKEIHVVSAAGSDYLLRKGGRRAMYQCGLADEPGRWDHWPSGLVTCAPLGASERAVFSLTLPYCDKQLAKRMLFAVDAELPEVAIAAPADGAFLRGEEYVVGGTSKDEGSWVTEVELSITPDGGAIGTFELAEGVRPWAFALTLPADGRYELLARARDHVGYEATSSPVLITVDNTPPTVTLELPGGSYVRPEDETVVIQGLAEDNLAGIRRVQISINRQPWRVVDLEEPGAQSTAWNYSWPVGENAQGRHQVLLRAIDRAGNQSEIREAELIVDQMAPTDELTDRTYLAEPPAVAVGQPHTLVGVANESGRLPAPARPPELLESMDIYDDTTVWLGLSSIADNDEGVVAAWIGDYDNDRLADLAVGLPASDRVIVLYGRAGDWAVPPDLQMLEESQTQFTGAEGSGLGALLSPAGDADVDGATRWPVPHPDGPANPDGDAGTVPDQHRHAGSSDDAPADSKGLRRGIVDRQGDAHAKGQGAPGSTTVNVLYLTELT